MQQIDDCRDGRAEATKQCKIRVGGGTNRSLLTSKCMTVVAQLTVFAALRGLPDGEHVRYDPHTFKNIFCAKRNG
jgi:hypothetical protein